MDDFFRFLAKSPTPYHATKELCYLLAEHDFSPLQLEQDFTLEKNCGYFVKKGNCVIAFFYPEKLESLKIVATHVDSPCFKLKPQPLLSNDSLSKFNVAPYGSPIYSTWTNRSLAVAGKVVYSDKNGKRKSALINLDQYPVMIAQPAIHINRQVNQEGINPINLNPVFSLNSCSSLEQLLEEELSMNKVLDFDLSLYPLEKPFYVGKQRECIAASRLDNLASAYSSASALVNSKTSNLTMAIFFNHEEVGSRTDQGAFSPLFTEVMQKICPDMKTYSSLKNQALCVSSDLTHALDYNFRERFDLETTPYLGKGPAIKYDSQSSYATTVETAAYLLHLAQEKNLSMQKYHVKSDSRAGGTIGSIFAAREGIATLDIGIPCLSMHAAIEMIATKDLDIHTLLLKEFFQNTEKVYA